MATVHTAYGPGRIIDQETVRGRTRYKVAGEGFEVWLDQTKLGGYETPAGGPDFNAPHWEGHNLDDGVTYPDVHIHPGDEYDDDQGIPNRFDRSRLRERPDYEGYSGYGGDDPAHYSRRLVGGYDEFSGEDDPYSEHEDDEHFTNLRDRFQGYDDDDPAKYSRRQASGYDESFDDDPYAEYEEDEHFTKLRDRFDGYDDDDPAKYSNRRVVRGKGSSSRTAWAPLDRDNSTELPYNPKPQFDAIGSYGDDNSSTMQPIHHIDPDERLHNSDSVTFEDEGDDDGPGPSAELFAREASIDLQAGIPPWLIRQQIQKKFPKTYKKVMETVERGVGGATGNPELGKAVMRGGDSAIEVGKIVAPLAAGNFAINKVMDATAPGSWGGTIKSSSYHEANPAMLLPLVAPALRALAPMALQSLIGGGSGGGDDEGGDMAESSDPGSWGGLVTAQNDRPAGLSDRYIDLTASVDYWNDPVAQFRHDPAAYINRIGHLMDEGLNPRFAEYMELVEGDRNVRTAAWKDVRKKAMRLKREGHVTVKDMSPSSIMASVVGDHGTYDVTILKGASIGGITGNSIANWHCACEWGRWAFRRKYTYVGRLCSHAYASYLTMQSAAMKGKRPTRRSPSDAIIVNRPARDRYLPTFTFAAGRQADSFVKRSNRDLHDFFHNMESDVRNGSFDARDAANHLRTNFNVGDSTLVEDFLENHASDLLSNEATTADAVRHFTRNFSAGLRTADALQNGPERMTPDMVVNDTDDAHIFVDVTKDERDDTGPDDVVSDKDIVHFARVMAECERTERPYPRQLVAFLARYADCGCTEDDTQADYEASDAGDADGALSRLRDLADDDAEDSFGSMADRVHEIQDAVEEARHNGADASQFVAAVRRIAADEGDSGLQDFGELVGNGLNNAGNAIANPFREIGQGYKQLTTPGYKYQDPNDTPLGQRVDFGNNDGPSKAEQNKANAAAEDEGKYDDDGPIGGPRNGPSPGPGPSKNPGGQQSETSTNKGTGGDGGGASGTSAGGSGGGGWKSPPGGTKGLVSDGGVAGAENGDNSSITKDMLDSDGYYTLKPGETLTDLAQRGYGDMNKYEELAKNNNITNADDLSGVTKIKFDSDRLTGNGGLSGDVTNPSGSTKAMNGPAVSGGAPASQAETTQNAGTSVGVDPVTPPPAPAVDVSAVTPGANSAAPAAPAPAVVPPAPVKPTEPTPTPTAGGEAKASRRRRAAEGDGTGSNETAPTTDSPSADAANPGTGSASTPATNPANPAGGTSRPAIPGGPSDSDVYDPNDPAQVQRQNNSAANPGTSMPSMPSMPGSGGSGMDMSGIGNMIGQGVGAASNIASGIGNMIGGGGLASGIGGLASGIGSAIGGIFSSKQDVDDWYRYAYPAGGGDDYDPETLPHLPFAGSGNPGPLEYTTSEDYADKARKKMDDVTDIGDDPLSTPMGDWQKQGAYDDDASDIVRAFQANLGDTALGSGAGGGGGRFDDLAGAAQGFLRTAGRNYSLAEQSELIREGDKGGAGNLRSLDLAGTHYEDMDSLGW